MANDTRNIRDAVKSFIPNWLSDRPGLNSGFSVLFTIALIADLFVEQMFQGWQAPLPSIGTPTALPYIGRSRGIIQGLLEPDDAYAQRLIAWLDLWTVAGSAETLVSLIQGFFGNTFVVRLVDRAGNFCSIAANGTITRTVDTAWNWDSFSAVSHATWWGDTWLIVYVTDGRWPIYSSFADPNWVATWGTRQGFGVGHRVTRDVVDGVYRILASFKGAHTYMRNIIFTDDTSLFVPGSLGSPATPDGRYDNWSKDSGAPGQVPARRTVATTYVRYWEPTYGG